MTTSTAPHPASKRNKSQTIVQGPSPHPTSGAPLEPIPMSKLTHSTELDEYTASMRNYLANVDHPGHSSRNSGSDTDSRRSSLRSESVDGSEREKSPEFRWMDLASVRRDHGSVNLSFPSVGKGTENRVSKSTVKSTSLHHHHQVGKDPRQHQRDHRSSSPGVKALLSKRHATQKEAKSAEKN
ncbi:uncharacterized protein Z520_10622 [Fonsecaea multimorphosa CBS 102226]|uniref:Uncharacterized protein n=1 Tax=Fonsecaea multimorphosa CBS 102226 TaxID=1442371 RepID=A0A0D2I958_9EURO|nr:uncharacterized protein Z520_10622 [Fonsecaea multimorphosa CBS 102226]KIX93716.1 hypothetical protein Z520_10622 [Fonsecaea multimorphosa CBS 102226]OAL19825.1 hypothetical protein AYO22_09352 [Fonsecaea multimorphosa]